MEVKKALSRLYIAVKAPPEPEDGPLEELFGSPLKGRRAELDAGEFAEKAALALSGPGRKVEAYRVYRTADESDPYSRYFDPAGVLEITLSAPAVSARKVKKTAWLYSASIRVRARLSAGGRVLDKLSETFSCTEERPDNGMSAADWYDGNWTKLAGALAERLSGRYTGRPALRAGPPAGKKDAAGSAGGGWFAVPAALLPFTDETASAEGPQMVRELLHGALSAAGYRLQPLDETDRLLLAHGLTQGGQLGAADQAELCGWLGVERLFYGDINEFGEAAAGGFSRRAVKGRVMLWDLRAGNFIWGLDAAAGKTYAPENFREGTAPRPAAGLAERVNNTPLAYEASLFAAKIAGALPGRAGIK